MSIVCFTPQPMNMRNLKIYCKTEDDQDLIVNLILENYPDAQISTWEPDPVDTGSWGMFVDEFPARLWGQLVEFLTTEESWALDEDVEMALECEEPRMYAYYP